MKLGTNIKQLRSYSVVFPFILETSTGVYCPAQQSSIRECYNQRPKMTLNFAVFYIKAWAFVPSHAMPNIKSDLKNKA